MPQRSTLIPASWGVSAVLGGALVALSCGHSEPFTTPSTGSDYPFDPGPPARLTLNTGPDRDPAWLPDGSGILYVAQQPGRSDHDVCLALLPASGGTQRQLSCDTPGGAGSTDAIASPAPASDGRLAFVEAAAALNALSPSTQAIALAPAFDPRGAAKVLSIPYVAENGDIHRGAAQLRWLDADHLIYLGQAVLLRRPCEPPCPYDTITTGLAITELDLRSPSAGPHVLPGTTYASGISTGSASDHFFFTVGGDSRVFRYSLPSGEIAVVYDFGTEGIARDISVVGKRMAAVVGGRVTFSNDPDLGPTQIDSGGFLHVVDLDTGSDQVLEAPDFFRHPALSPDGSRLVVEGYPLLITREEDPMTGQIIVDTTISRAGDLLLFEPP